MIKALAPGMRRGCRWVWLSIVLVAALGFPTSAGAQGEPKKPGSTPKKSDSGTARKPGGPPREASTTLPKKDSDPAAKDGDAAKKKSDEKEEPGPPDEGDDEGSVEVFKDANAEKALTIFASVPGLQDRIRPGEINTVKAMSANQAAIDGDLIQKYVQSMAYRLTEKSSINALINPPPNQRPNAAAARAIQAATDNLLEPLQNARLAKNQAFLNAYIPELVATLPKLLNNNLVTRTEAMIVLGEAGTPLAMPIYLSQIKDPNQTVQVKIWAMKGVANAVDNGVRVNAIPAAEAINAGKAIADFLEANKDTLWFLKLRALEAMGAMRQSAVPVNARKAEMATAAMKILANAETRPEVRAAAAWALGMAQVSQSSNGYNYPLIAYNTGRLAAEVGEKVGATNKENPTRANYLASLLVGPIYQTFNGVDGARESGLIKSPAAAASQDYLSKINALTSSVARAAVELVRAVGTQVEGKKKDLGDRVAELKTFLDKNPPKDFHLVPGPGSPEFRPGSTAVADAPEANKKLAGAPRGR